MVEGQSMTTVADVVAQVRDGRLEDFVREVVALVARELMNAEISGEIGAELGEVALEQRSTHRNGYRPRGWETRVGEIELLISQAVRAGVLPVVFGSAASGGAGDRGGRDGGLRHGSRRARSTASSSSLGSAG
jgi:hypothetical protein